MAIRIAIVGYGKIARDQHVPAIHGNPDFALAATVSRQGKGDPDHPCFTSHGELIAAGDIDAVAICTPPAARYAIARDCILAGLHCLLEKPPGMSLGEVEELAALAAHRQVSLFTTWHAQHANAVEAAAERLARRRIRSMRIDWREDVRKWHPGQAWIWEPGGFGVFDPGINALSIASRILPMPLFVREATLLVPENRQTPIAARIEFHGEAARAELDWRYTEGERWTIELRCDDGTLIELDRGGAELRIDGKPQPVEEIGEYPSLYRRFAELVQSGRSEVDREPLRIVADAMLLGRTERVEPFL